MRPAAVCAFILLTLFVHGCRGDDRAQTVRAPSATATHAPAAAPSRAATSASPAEVATPRASIPAPLPSSDLHLPRALLTLEDLPEGWTVAEPRTSTVNARCTGQGIRQTPIDVARAEFQQSAAVGAFHAVGVYRSGEAKQAMADALQSFQNCSTWTGKDNYGNPLTLKTLPLSFPKLGDETIAVHLSMTASTMVAEADMVVIRRGDIISIVVFGAIGLEPVQVDSAVTEQLARKADAKLAALTGTRIP